MKLLRTQLDTNTLTRLGEEACEMLIKHDYIGLAKRFGYALANDKEPAHAIEADFLRASASPHVIRKDEPREILVKYFKPGSSQFFAVIECTVPIAEKTAVLLELIVLNDTDNSEIKHIVLEDISGT